MEDAWKCFRKLLAQFWRIFGRLVDIFVNIVCFDASFCETSSSFGYRIAPGPCDKGAPKLGRWKTLPLSRMPFNGCPEGSTCDFWASWLIQ